MLSPVRENQSTQNAFDADALEQRVAAQCDALVPGNGTRRIAVAVSGGPDSMALLHLVGKWVAARRCEVLVFTVDHGLRAEAAAEALQVAKWSKSLGYMHRTLTWRGDKPAGDLQARARNARYDLLLQACLDADAAHLFLGHHLDDQYETVLLRLQGKSGVRGMSGMLPKQRFHGVELIRPLLSLERRLLRRYLQNRDIEWLADPSNEDRKFARVRVRQQLASWDGTGGPYRSLCELVTNAGKLRNLSERLTASAARSVATVSDVGSITLSWSGWRCLPVTLASEILQQALLVVGGTHYRPDLQAARRLITHLKSDEAGTWRTLANCAVRTHRGSVQIIREHRHLPARKEVPRSGSLQWGGFHILIDAPQDGDHIAPLGKSGFRQVSGSIAEIETIEQAPKSHLATLPCIMRQEKIVFVPFLGFMDPEIANQSGKIHVKFTPRHDFYGILAVAG